MMSLMWEIASDSVLEEAYQWLCERRRDYSHNDDVWRVRQHWAEVKRVLQRALVAGRYRFCPLRRMSLLSFFVPSVPCPFLLGWIAIRCSTPLVGSPFGLQPRGEKDK